MKVRELPDVERPSFKLRYFGSGSLSDAELIQLLTGASDLESAYTSLAESGGLSLMRKMTMEELKKISGIGETSAIKLIAASELGARIAAETPYGRQRLFSAEDVYKMFATELAGEKQEIVLALLLNSKFEIIGRETISKGTMVSACVEPRDIFRSAIKRVALNIIMVHNHPSGDPTPSEEDLNVTAQIEMAGELVGIRLIDHIIIGMGRHASLREMNFLSGDDKLGPLIADRRNKEKDKERER